MAFLHWNSTLHRHASWALLLAVAVHELLPVYAEENHSATVVSDKERHER